MNMLIDTKKAAMEIGIKPGTLYGYVEQSLVPYVRVGRSIRFDLNELLAWFRSGKFEQARTVKLQGRK